MEKNINDIDVNNRIQIALTVEVFRRIESTLENTLIRLKNLADVEQNEESKNRYKCSMIECQTNIKTFQHIIPMLNSLVYDDKEGFLKNMFLMKDYFNIV